MDSERAAIGLWVSVRALLVEVLIWPRALVDTAQNEPSSYSYSAQGPWLNTGGRLSYR